MAIADNFKVVDRLHGSCWLHKDKPVWIVHYPLLDSERKYVAYVPVRWVGIDDLKDRDPWTLDNYRLTHWGYATLEEAMIAADKWEWR